MARSLSTAKLLAAALVAENLPAAITRQSFAAASHGLSSAGGSRVGMAMNIEEMVLMKDTSAAAAWAPDPVTGYYQPSNRAVEMDAVELRAMLLKKHKITPQ